MDTRPDEATLLVQDEEHVVSLGECCWEGKHAKSYSCSGSKPGFLARMSSSPERTKRISLDVRPRIGTVIELRYLSLEHPCEQTTHLAKVLYRRGRNPCSDTVLTVFSLLENGKIRKTKGAASPSRSPIERRTLWG